MALLVLVTVNVFANDVTGGKVDPYIENKFKEQYGSSMSVTWKVVEDVSIATFIEHGREKQVYYFNDGQMFGFGAAISRSSLPAAVEKSINNRFASPEIQVVYEFRPNDAPTQYFVQLRTKRHLMIVAANEFGALDVRKKTKI